MIDSGCTKHMTYKRCILKEFIPMKKKKELGMAIVFLQKGKSFIAIKTNTRTKKIRCSLCA